MLKSILKSALFFAGGFAILYFVYQNQAAAFQLECQCKGGCPFDSLFDKIVHDFKQANLGILALVCLGFMLSAWSRALRWNLLLEPLGYRPRALNGFFAIMSGYLFNLALPRAGEISKPALFSRYEKIPLDKLIGTIVVDRVFDVIMLLLMIGLAFLVQFPYLYGFLFGDARPSAECVVPMPAAEGGGFPWKMIFLGFMALGVLALVLAFVFRENIKQQPFYQRFKLLSANFVEGIKAVFRLKHPYWFLFHTVFIWFMFYLTTYLCFFAYPPTADLGPAAALLVFVFGGFGILIPSPGGIGTYHVAVTAALVIYGVAKPDAFSFANISFFTVNIFACIFFGILAYILLPIYNRGYVPPAPEPTNEPS